mgnify:CR=1 FL=1
MADKTLDKITIIRGTVFAGAVRAEGDVCEVTDATRKDAEGLLARGKAVEGSVAKAKAKAPDKAPDKAITSADLDTK